jgi:hypothetical protein
MDPREFHQDLKQEVATRAESNGDFTESAFAEVASDFLLETGSITEFNPCPFRQRGMKIDGYAFVPDEATLDMFVVDYTGGEEPDTFTRKDLEQSFKRIEAFFERCLNRKFVEEIEVSHPAYGLGRQILEESDSLSRVRFFLLTDSILSERVKDLPSREVEGREWSYRVWDLERLSKVMATGEPEEIVVDFVDLFGRGLPCLPAALENADLQCYLAVVPGDWLARIYSDWSGRLLEQNVRTFLQLKGGINKGIRQTILKEPQNFFPYNNGISTTAEHAEVVEESGRLVIRSLRNFQIVNGGQTTASLYNAMKRDKEAARIDQIRVQMKLTVVAPEKVQDLVPKISKFSNSQNKISDADFFSNHPFHVRIENISRRMWAPALGGSQIHTHWFYERARGQYANQQAYLKTGEKKAFLLQNPRNQVITKTDLATSMNTFRQLPHEVRRGAQKNFAKFAEFINEKWEQGDSEFSEIWFQQAVARTIIFRATEKIVQEAPWYASWGFRSAIVTYSIAALVRKLASIKLCLDLKKVWLNQQVGPGFREQILMLGELVQSALNEGAERHNIKNVQEWSKRPACWDEISKIEFKPLESLGGDLTNIEDAKEEGRDGRRSQRMLTDLESQIRVTDLGGTFWTQVLKWADGQQDLSPGDLQLLGLAASIPKRLPNPKQSKRLLEIESKYSEDAGDADVVAS